MRKVLMVSYYFPPIGGIGSIRAAAFAKHLPEFGWEATVLAPAHTPHLSDPTLDVDAVPVVRARSFELGGHAHGRATGSGDAGPPAPNRAVVRSAASRRLRRIVKHVIFPDPQIGWYPAAAAAGRREVRRGNFDLIFSSAFPITSHLVAWTALRRPPLPWVAEFRDPWSDDPEFRFVSTLAHRLERAISARADAVVLPSQRLAEYYASRWGVEATVIGHGCEITSRPPVRRPSPPVLAHVGSYYPGRQSLETLWSALAEMRWRGDASPRLRWVGAFPDEARAEIERHGLGDILDLIGFVPQPEALSLMSGASALIASDFVDTSPLSLGCLPAKLPEYVASGVPIVYVGHPAGEAARVLSRYPGCHVVPFGDVDSAIQAVQAAVNEEVHQRDVSDLTRRARTAELAELFDTVVARRAG